MHENIGFLEIRFFENIASYINNVKRERKLNTKDKAIFVYRIAFAEYFCFCEKVLRGIFEVSELQDALNDCCSRDA